MGALMGKKNLVMVGEGGVPAVGVPPYSGWGSLMTKKCIINRIWGSWDE